LTSCNTAADELQRRFGLFDREVSRANERTGTMLDHNNDLRRQLAREHAERLKDDFNGTSNEGLEPKPSPACQPLASIVHAAAKGDERGWEALHARFTPILRAAARMLRLGPADVDDVVQQTWLAAVTHIHTLRQPEAIGAWLIVTARREALRTIRRGVREVATDDLPEQAQEASPPPGSDLIDEERRVAVHAAVRRLDGRKRLVVDALLRTPEVSYVDLAQRLEMPIGSIGPTRERALDRLRSDSVLGAVLSGAAA
jgi:RNA polymerase sigma factor (sigma-70 family)